MQNLEKQNIYGWGLSASSNSIIFKPKSPEELKKMFFKIKKSNLTNISCGKRFSYGDVFLNQNGFVIDNSNLNKILKWDVSNGVMNCESGVTFQKILKLIYKDDWILPVVPGNRYTTMGGAVSNNVHGKNNFKYGSFGEWVRSFRILLADGNILKCTKEQNKELFNAVIGGVGLMGVILEVEIQLIAEKSKTVLTKKWTVNNLENMLSHLINASKKYDYVIGQIDTFSTKKQLGRGTIHAANFYSEKTKKQNEFEKDLERSSFFLNLLLNKFSFVVRFFENQFIFKIISKTKYYFDYLENKISKSNEKIQSFPKFNFFLDRVQNWPKIFKYGIYEFEPLLPKDCAFDVICKIFNIYNKYGLPAYLSGIKLHKKDEFLISYSLNGFSVGFDFPVIPAKEKIQEKMFDELHDLVVKNGGLVYLAKDSLMKPHHFKKMYINKLEKFLDCKLKYDPNQFFQSNMYRRLFLDRNK